MAKPRTWRPRGKSVSAAQTGHRRRRASEPSPGGLAPTALDLLEGYLDVALSADEEGIAASWSAGYREAYALLVLQQLDEASGQLAQLAQEARSGAETGHGGWLRAFVLVQLTRACALRQVAAGEAAEATFQEGCGAVEQLVRGVQPHELTGPKGAIWLLSAASLLEVLGEAPGARVLWAASRTRDSCRADRSGSSSTIAVRRWSFHSGADLLRPNEPS